jgi:hypothetical protein
MTPQFCTEPEPNGDCWRACLATIIDRPGHELPNFMHCAQGETYDDGIRRAQEFLRPHGLTIFTTYISAGWPLERVLERFSKPSPGAAIILSGMSIADPNTAHAVVVLDGSVVHDPSGAGICAPARCSCGDPSCKDTWWMIDVVAPLTTLEGNTC